MSKPFKPEREKEEQIELVVRTSAAESSVAESSGQEQSGAENSELTHAGGKTSGEEKTAGKGQDQLDTSEARVRTILSILQPKKKPKYRIKALALLIVASPLALLAFSLCSDPASWPYFKANILDKKESDKLADLSRAYQARPDREILEHRADAYGLAGNWEAQRQDLQTLIDGGDTDARTLLRMGENIIERQGMTREAAQMLRLGVQKWMADFKAYPHGRNEYLYSVYDDAYRLLCYGDADTALAVCQAMPEKKAYICKDYLEALALREKGDSSRILYLLKKSQTESSLGGYGDARSYYAEALYDLDHNDLAAAQEAFAAGKKLHKFKQDYTLQRLVQVWLAYQKGDYAATAKIAGDALAKVEHDWSTQRTSSLKAALNLLRGHALEKLGKSRESEAALAAYSKSDVNGAVFVPKPYRNWIKQSPQY